jgi:hypothetical protein
MSFNLTGGNPRAHRIRVYFVETSTTIYEGMPVCYEFDTTTNWHGGSMSLGAITESSTTAEGSQNEGKYIRVELPDADNGHSFAGVVAKGSWCGTTTGSGAGRVLDIYVPNGAIVPVRTDLNCTIGRTVLAVESASVDLTVPLAASTARPVAVAWETVDRSSTSGLVLAKLEPNLFIHQQGDANSLLMDDDATAAETVNSINLNFSGTGGPKRGLYAVGEISGAGHSLYGMWKFRTYLNAAASSVVNGVCANLHIKDSGTLTRTSGEVNSALYVTVETEVSSTAPTLSGGDLCGITVNYYVDESTAAPANAYALYCNCGTYNWDGLLWIRNAGDMGDSAMTADHTFDTSDKCIPVLIGNYTGGTTYYIPLMNNKGD